jgi:hypothetical protein
MLSLRRGTVSAIADREEGLVRLEVDGTPCVAFPRLTGPVAVGDDVVVNVQARELGLGSGGFDVLHVNLTRGLGLAPEPGAHVMTLPYTPIQQAVVHGEEGGLDAELAGTPVVCCSVHSQLAPVCAALAGLRIAYVQLAGGALPVSLSDTVRALKERSLVEVAVAASPCFDGDVQCVNVASALAWSRGFDAVVCAVGPGIVGTGSELGHGAVAAAEAANHAGALGGVPVVALRASELDPRERHRGVSHHSRAVLRLCRVPVRVAGDSDEVDASGWRDACEGLPLSHMGRGADDDPAFFETAFAAGVLARSLV